MSLQALLAFHGRRAFALGTGLILASKGLLGVGVTASAHCLSNSHLVRIQYQHARESAER
jgi:hypothetical protein